MIEPLYIVFIVLLILLAAVVLPKALKAQSSDGESLLKTALLKKQSGSLSEAEYYFQKALDAFKSESLPDFAKMSTCLIQLADIQSKSGQYAQAREHYAKLISMWSDAINKDNPEIFLEIDYLASTAEFGSGTNDVADCYAKIIEAKKRVFGIDHPDIATSLKIYALLLHKLGRKADAELAEKEAVTLLAERN